MRACLPRGSRVRDRVDGAAAAGGAVLNTAARVCTCTLGKGRRRVTKTNPRSTALLAMSEGVLITDVSVTPHGGDLIECGSGAGRSGRRSMRRRSAITVMALAGLARL